ncbi:SDR family oxidoreductase [Streptomyces sp. NPDC005374]|uniref:SDR family oxidoreductase n=1 Tax=Streptomyces sp. NPDC005374 TaxID=3364713 RepID=UPI0036C40D3A
MSINTKPGPTILLTGASGVVGQAVLGQLTDHTVVCLTHNKPVSGPDVVSVRGDLTFPRFGLDRAAYESLANRVDVVVHCAAITAFSVDASRTNDLNVRGTETILAFAQRAKAPLHHVSTAFVTRQDLTREGKSSARPEVYLDSKRLAEQAIRDSGVAANIIRPSVVIGDSATGQISQFQGLHGIAGALLRNALPMLPLQPDTRIDFVPQDLLARVIVGLVQAGKTGGEYWVTGGDGAPSAGRIVELSIELARSFGLKLDTPRFVSQDMVDRLIRPVFIDSLPKGQRRRFDDMLAMTTLFHTAEPFSSTYDRIPGVELLSTTDLEHAFTASMRHYATVKNLIRLSEVAA